MRRRGEQICAFCDDGGDIILCDGGCRRSFCLEPACQAKFGLPEQFLEELDKGEVSIHPARSAPPPPPLSTAIALQEGEAQFATGNEGAPRCVRPHIHMPR